jgi:hypothetical protein
MLTHRTFFTLCILSLARPLGAIPLVYNLRIGETTRAINPSFGEIKPSIIALTPVAQFRHFKNDFEQSLGGVLGSYIYMHNDLYARINVAVGRVHAQIADTEPDFSKIQTDDILLTAGYSWQLGSSIRIGLSGHLGIPTHKDDSLNLVQLGTGHVGLGLQLDGSASLSETQMLLAAARLICFLPRNLTITATAVTTNIDYNLGNAIDLLCAYQQSWREHMIYFGYNPTFTFETDNLPGIAGPPTFHTTTNSFFFTYRYGFLIKDMLSAIIFGVSY